MLTTEEKITIANYDKFALPWVQEHVDTDVFDSEFPKFQKYLPKGRILEIGSGGGRDAIKISRAGYEYTGIDRSEGLLEEARKIYPNLRFYNQSIYGISFPESSFDGFWCAATLIHLPKRRIYEALGNIHRVIKPSGVGVIILKKGEGDMVCEQEEVDGQTFTRYFTYYQEPEFANILNRARFLRVESSALPVGRKTTWLNFIVKKSDDKD